MLLVWILGHVYVHALISSELILKSEAVVGAVGLYGVKSLIPVTCVAPTVETRHVLVGV